METTIQSVEIISMACTLIAIISALIGSCLIFTPTRTKVIGFYCLGTLVFLALGAILHRISIQYNKTDFEKVRQVKGKIIEKKYVPRTAAYRSTIEDQFILIYTNSQGNAYKIDNSRLYGKVEKGDSVIVFYNVRSGDQPDFLNIKKF